MGWRGILVLAGEILLHSSIWTPVTYFQPLNRQFESFCCSKSSNHYYWHIDRGRTQSSCPRCHTSKQVTQHIQQGIWIPCSTNQLNIQSINDQHINQQTNYQIKQSNYRSSNQSISQPINQSINWDFHTIRKEDIFFPKTRFKRRELFSSCRFLLRYFDWTSNFIRTGSEAP